MNRIRRAVNPVRVLFLNRLARRAPLLTIYRWLRWKLLARRGTGALVVPFVDGTRIRVDARNRDARAYTYLGLPEFEDMGFVLHAARPGDLFVDVGAYIGAYTLLAAGACGAHVVAIEPNPDNREDLVRNVELNGLAALVEIKAVAVGANADVVKMPSGAGSDCRVVAGPADVSTFDVGMDTLDSVLGERRPSFLKVDVEGFESDVIAGGQRAFESPTLLAVLLELNSSGLSHGREDQAVHDRMLQFGFHPFSYDPWTRSLASLHDRINPRGGNTLYLRDVATIQQRIERTRSHRVHHTAL